MPGDFLDDDIDTMINTSEFAYSAVYTPDGGSPTAIDVIYDPNEVQIDPYTGAQAVIPPSITAKTTDVTGIRHKDVFVVDSVTYEVTKHVDNKGVTFITLNYT